MCSRDTVRCMHPSSNPQGIMHNATTPCVSRVRRDSIEYEVVSATVTALPTSLRSYTRAHHTCNSFWFDSLDCSYAFRVVSRSDWMASPMALDPCNSRVLSASFACGNVGRPHDPPWSIIPQTERTKNHYVAWRCTSHWRKRVSHQVMR